MRGHSDVWSGSLGYPDCCVMPKLIGRSGAGSASATGMKSRLTGWGFKAAHREARAKKKRTPQGLPYGVQESAMTYFPSEKYHRQQRLNCCVRDGNRCFPLLIYTDNPTCLPLGEARRLKPSP